jgi:hypothetical protein
MFSSLETGLSEKNPAEGVYCRLFRASVGNRIALGGETMLFARKGADEMDHIPALFFVDDFTDPHRHARAGTTVS